MTDRRREVLFVTGTRADFGKLRDVMLAVQASAHLAARVVVTGMHLLRRYGYTVHEVERVGLQRLHLIPNQVEGEPTALVLANTVQALARLVYEERPDAIVVQGDRVEALAAALVGSLHNVRVIHIEGGELSGAIDDSVRHSISKHAHVHLVANDQARARLEQMGEEAHRVFVVGSPEIDILTSPDLPALDEVRARYDIPFDRYGVLVVHPVTTEPGANARLAASVVDAVLASAANWVIIDPNNDEGCADIRLQLDRCVGDRFARLPSMRFEHFVTLMRNARVVLGNSSSGVREAPVVGTRSVNVGTRQRGRTEAEGVVNVAPDAAEIRAAVDAVCGQPRLPGFHEFGAPGARGRIIELFEGDALWEPSLYKRFVDR
ncbi:UDP-N-acetylglucosamine 2-epimerase [Actinokineospora globicatena]|uniref:UDP-N-acetylglucosamine 2-epimerase n=1 Tax=Actinokineospora globicatena TaxID=103729 RepID=UPI0020A2D80B|nr:UDP-N-acetylglucosamine 2-epimerase [Actinokineospora globicatena]MCP2301091.1 UDP-N-acetylglucosamine 2-epimerase (hydrolyzing) [Actinokineospora globicatena]GLW77273.1 UDP-N-acetylglucosamine 2-epimerase [Actinokineospora globicatena]GLW84107.1 UDP-N-acetylglucosamine 2-epimerase [Actinokineospora globicatena]